MKKGLLLSILMFGSMASANCNWYNTGGGAYFTTVKECKITDKWVVVKNLEDEVKAYAKKRIHNKGENNRTVTEKTCMIEMGQPALYVNYMNYVYSCN